MQKIPRPVLARAPDLGAELLKGQFADFSYDLHAHDTASAVMLRESARFQRKTLDIVTR
jgi:hypothetical protein